MPLDIVGAGMAGLLAGNILRHHNPVIVEKQAELPNNHSAVLRFRTSVVGDVLGIPFKKVSMIKATLPYLNPVADALLYSFKNTGYYRTDRSITSDIQSGERFIAPPDFIARMAANLDIKFGREYDGWIGVHEHSTPAISTLPMPIAMKLLGYPYRDKVDFGYIKGVNIRAKIQSCEAYVSLMVPDPQEPYSRVSITGNELVIEVPNSNKFLGPDEHLHYVKIAERVANRHFGIPSVALYDIIGKRQDYAKIVPIDEDIRKDFIFWATDKHNVYSLGRFATWRPKLLLDDLVNDIRLIDRWIQRKDRYAIARHR